MMRHTLLAMTALATALAGCAPTSYSGYAKSGVSRDAAIKDDTTCSVEANRLFPAATFASSVYGGYSSGYGGYVGGTWGGYPGAWGSNQVHLNDANAGLRAEHRRDCMTLKGYTPVTHPVCTKAQLNGQSYAAVPGAPKPAPNICAVRTPGDRVALIDLNTPI